MMTRNLHHLLIILITTLFVSCSKSQLSNQKEYDKSYQSWLGFKKRSANSYLYKVGGGSWVGIGWETEIKVVQGIVTGRSFHYSFPPNYNYAMPDSVKSWTEAGALVGVHKNTAAAEPLTLDEVYSRARSEWLVKRADAQIFFKAENNGILSECGYVPDGCQDDCFVGISIFAVQAL